MKAKTLSGIAFVSAFVLVVSVVTVCAAPHATVTGKYMDDFARETLDAPGAGITLSDGVTLIYWNAHYNGTFSIVDSVLVAECSNGGCYRFATSCGLRLKYCIVRMKGDARASNHNIYMRIASQGPTDSGGISDANKGGVSERMMDSLVDPDSLNLPEISDTFQTFVIDLAKNGLHLGDVGGANAFQFGSHAAMQLNVDYIFTSNINPNAANGIKSPGTGKVFKSQTFVWAVGPSDFKVRTADATAKALSLYDLRGKLVRNFALSGRETRIHVPAGSLMPNVYLYTVSGNEGTALVKGKISLR
jgi:hypothetical protein